MKIVLEDMDRKHIKTINNIERENFFNYSPKVISIDYNENFKLFDKLDYDTIILRPCEKSKDFIIEYISENYIDYINSSNDLDIEISYDNIVGRYLSKTFPFIENYNLLKIFNEIVENKGRYEFREIKYIDNILVSSYRHKIFICDDKLFHLAYFENDLELLYFTGEEFFDKSERPYILVEGNEILKVNNKFLEYFNCDKEEILAYYDIKKLKFDGLSLDDFNVLLNNLLNRKSFFEIFEFSYTDSENKERWLKGFASPSSFNFRPAVKIFFQEITEEKRYESESLSLRDTLRLVQNENAITGFFKNTYKDNRKLLDTDIYNSDDYHEENILNSSIDNSRKRAVFSELDNDSDLGLKYNDSNLTVISKKDLSLENIYDKNFHWRSVYDRNSNLYDSSAKNSQNPLNFSDREI